MKTGSRWTLTVATLAGVFGVATVAKGTQVLFGSSVARVEAGHYVPFVLWFNFLAGFAYLAAALVFLAFGAHVLSGGAFETGTVAAMTLRTAAWGAIALVTSRHLSHTTVPSGR